MDDRPQRVALQGRPETLRRDRRSGALPLRTRRREPTRVLTPLRNRHRGRVNSSRAPIIAVNDRRGRRLRSPRRKSQEQRPAWRGRDRRSDIPQTPRRSLIPSVKNKIRERRGALPRTANSRRENRGEVPRTSNSKRERRKEARQARSHSQVKRSYRRESIHSE